MGYPKVKKPENSFFSVMRGEGERGGGGRVGVERLIWTNYISRYYHQRRSIFSRYDDGIWMTEDAWYGVTPEPVAKYALPFSSNSLEKLLLPHFKSPATTLTTYCPLPTFSQHGAI